MPRRPAPKREPRAKTKPPPTPPAPLWVPNNVDRELVPDEIQQAITQIVQPVYERFVIARGPNHGKTHPC